MGSPTVTQLIDLGCAQLALLSNGDAILQPKRECSTRIDAKKVSESLSEVTPKIRQTIYVSSQLFNLREGAEVPIVT